MLAEINIRPRVILAQVVNDQVSSLRVDSVCALVSACCACLLLLPPAEELPPSTGYPTYCRRRKVASARVDLTPRALR